MYQIVKLSVDNLENNIHKQYTYKVLLQRINTLMSMLLCRET